MTDFSKTFSIEGIEELQSKVNMLKQVPAQVRSIALAQTGHLMAGYCKINCPVITGRLRASIGNPQKGGVFDQFPDYIIFGTAVEYAVMVEEGVAPHKVVPVNKKALSWIGKDNKRITVKSVMNPGFAGRHYMQKGITQSINPAVDFLASVIGGAVTI